MKPICATLAAIAVSLSCLGCGDGWQAETHPVTGRLTINGEPPEGAVVTLYPVDEKVDVRNSRPWGVVQDDGTFELSTYERGDGAPAGQYTVTVKWPWDVTDLSLAMTDRLGGKHTRPEQSQRTVTIEAGNNVLAPIAINGADVAELPPNGGGQPAAPPGPPMSPNG